MSVLLRVLGIFAGVCLLAATVAAQQNSGFLGDAYSKLQDAQSPSGAKVKRWMAPGVTAGQYEAVLLEKTVLYPEPQGTDQLSAATLDEITAYLDEALRRELGTVIKVVTQPGPKTLRLKPAITAVASKDQGLKPYQIIPVAFVFTMAKKAAGNAPKQASLSVEYEARDAQTNELVAAGMRQGSEPLKNPTDKISLAAVKPVIDGWAKDARMFFQPKPKQ
jgi:hypothetical protein